MALQIGDIAIGIIFKSRAEMIWVVAASCAIAIAGTGKAIQGIVAETVGPGNSCFDYLCGADIKNNDYGFST